MHIGLFDSGVGGLTVLRELKAAFPKADFTYLGDTARLPYGNKAPETLRKYTAENIEFLESQGVDIIVIACHSASSIALETRETSKGVPVLNVIAPSGVLAQATSKNHKVAVMATKATIRSQVYPNYFKGLEKNLEVVPQECPLLVPLVEEGLLEDEVTDFILRRYLKPIQDSRADTVILGCTHYPLLKSQISKILGPAIHLIDPAEAVAQQIAKNHNPREGSSRLSIYLTDHAPHFILHAQSLLGPQVQAVFLTPES